MAVKTRFVIGTDGFAVWHDMVVGASLRSLACALISYSGKVVWQMRRREFIALVGAVMGLPLLARAQAKGKQDMGVPVVRVSLGAFDADKAAICRS